MTTVIEGAIPVGISRSEPRETTVGTRAFAAKKFKVIFPLVFVLLACLIFGNVKHRGTREYIFYILHCGLSMAAFFIYTHVFRAHVDFPMFARTCLFGGLTSVGITLGLGLLVSFIAGTSFEELNIAKTNSRGASAKVVGCVFAYALIEEIGKLAALMFHVPLANYPHPRHASHPRQFVLLGGAVGFGFEILENFCYFASFLVGGQESIAMLHVWAIVRTVQSLHPATTSIAAWSLKRNYFKTFAFSFRDFSNALILPTIIHFGFNASVMFFPLITHPAVGLVCSYTLLIGLFYRLYYLCSHKDWSLV